MTEIQEDPRWQFADAVFESVEIALRMQKHDEVDHWEFSDATARDIDAQAEDGNGFRPPDQHSHTNTGLYQAIENVRLAIKRAGATDVAKQDKIAKAYHTAKAWPPETRVEGANYWAHHELHARTYDGRRQAILQKLVRESSDGHVSTPEVRLWKSNSTPPDMTPRDEKLTKAIDATLHRWASPQKFTQLHQDERDFAIRLLKQRAAQIATNDFE